MIDMFKSMTDTVLFMLKLLHLWPMEFPSSWLLCPLMWSQKSWWLMLSSLSLAHLAHFLCLDLQSAISPRSKYFLSVRKGILRPESGHWALCIWFVIMHGTFLQIALRKTRFLWTSTLSWYWQYKCPKLIFLCSSFWP